jgi:hypothetical protein
VRLRRTRPVTTPRPAVAGGADAFLESYVSWRAACIAVRTAYESWRDCEPPLRFLAFDSYRAALDQEEDAARTHSELTEQLRRVAA